MNRDDWLAERVGHVTASRMADVMAKGQGTTRANYMAQLIAERLSGVPTASYVSAAMQWGLDHEDEAKAAYEFRTDADIAEPFFVHHPRIEWSGATPDGFIGQGLVEFKCPLTATHLDTLIRETVPRKYLLQMHWQMACANAAWCDYVSYDPRLPGDMKLYVQRIERDEDTIAELETAVESFLSELDTKLDALESKYGASDILLNRLKESVA